MPQFNGKLKYQDCPYGKLRLNIYGSKPAENTYYKGIAENLRQHGYIATETDPCIFTKNSTENNHTTGSTSEDFLVAGPTSAHISQFAEIIRPKYQVRDLGPQTNIYAGAYTAHKTANKHITATYPRKTLAKVKMKKYNAKTTPFP